MRVAAVDLGTNTTRLLVADVEHGLLDPIVRREVITRLGEASRRLTVSQARLGVQLQAVREARETVRRLLWFVPGA